MIRFRLGLLASLLTATLLHQSCAESPPAATPTDTPLCVSDSMQQLIRLDTVQLAQVLQEVKLNGKVTFNEERVVRIMPLVTGNVTGVRAELGDYVTQGQVLCTIKSPDIASLSEGLEQAKAELRRAEANLHAVTELHASQLASERELQAARSEVEREQAELRKVIETLQIYGADGPTQVVRASRSGYIVQKNVTEGMQSRAGDDEPLFVISELNEVWVMAQVFESDIAAIRPGQQAEIRVVSYPDTLFTGVIDKVYNVLDPNTQTLQARVRIPNPGIRLKPEMFATVHIRYPISQTLPQVSANALIFDNNRQYVMVYEGRCNFRPVPVQPTFANSRFVYVQDGLPPGTIVVSKSQLLLYDAYLEH
jgi:cobalt-zinc-cadmium efflux system membrane fusion protein